MRYFDARLIDYSIPRFTDPHTQIGFLIISRCISVIEPVQLLKHGSAHHQECAGAIIDIAAKLKFRFAGVAATPITEARSIPPDDAARLLQSSVEQNNLAADGADVGLRTQCVVGNFDGVRWETRVVVEQQD